MTVYFETRRLIARDYQPEDLPAFTAMNQDDAVMRYFPHKLNVAESKVFMEKLQLLLTANNYGLFALEEKRSRAFIGFTGFHLADFESSFTPATEIGWRLCEEKWHQGYATEAARGALDYAAAKTALQEVISFTAKANLPSQKVMQRIGMTFAGAFIHPRVAHDSPLADHVLYHLNIK